MALILHEQKRIRCKSIRVEDKQYKLSQILKPASLEALERLKAGV